MIIRSANNHHPRGILLIDLLVFISLVGFILILVAIVFDRFLNQSSSLRRNISDIDRALKAGERWRADIRAATATPQFNANALTIPHEAGNLIYTLGTNVTRKSANSELIETVLTGVRTNQIILEQRAHAAVWRWEIELDQRRKNAKVRPLFTFMAVSGAQ
jgi:hypothetical protein